MYILKYSNCHFSLSLIILWSSVVCVHVFVRVLIYLATDKRRQCCSACVKTDESVRLHLLQPSAHTPRAHSAPSSVSSTHINFFISEMLLASILQQCISHGQSDMTSVWSEGKLFQLKDPVKQENLQACLHWPLVRVQIHDKLHFFLVTGCDPEIVLVCAFMYARVQDVYCVNCAVTQCATKHKLSHMTVRYPCTWTHSRDTLVH